MRCKSMHIFFYIVFVKNKSKYPLKKSILLWNWWYKWNKYKQVSYSSDLLFSLQNIKQLRGFLKNLEKQQDTLNGLILIGKNKCFFTFAKSLLYAKDIIEHNWTLKCLCICSIHYKVNLISFFKSLKDVAFLRVTIFANFVNHFVWRNY